MLKTLATLGRRLIRFRLRTLFVLMTVLAIVLGGCVARSKRQAEGVKALWAQQAYVYYDYQRNGDDWDQSRRRWDRPGYASGWESPSWRRLFVSRFGASHSPITEEASLHIQMQDDDFFHLSKLPALQELVVNSAPLTDRALYHIGRAPSLEKITLRLRDFRFAGIDPIRENVGVSDSGLAHLANLKRLKTLSITNESGDADRPTITDAGLAALERLASLERLSLTGQEIHGPGLQHLLKLTRLRELSLVAPRLRDDGIRHIAKMSNLEELALALDRISDAGMRDLAQMNRLSRLWIHGESETESLHHLEGSTALRELHIFMSHPELMGPALKELESAKPGLKTTLNSIWQLKW